MDEGSRGKTISRAISRTHQSDPSLIIWEPQPRQAQALACPAFEVFFGGAKGGGKSDFLLGDFAAGIEEWGPAWKGILFRRSYKELDEIIGRSKEIYGRIPGARFVGGDQLTWYFPGGATLRFRSLEKQEDVSKYNGHQYTWIGFDELTEFPNGEAYIFMIGCCRSGAGAPCYMRATGNPGRPGHVWVKARFIDPMRPFELYKDPESGLTRCFIPSKLEDNQILMKNDPEYEKRLLLQPKHLQRALRWGEWDLIVGQVFDEFSRERHVIRRGPLDWSWFRFCAMDWGYSRPFSIGWWAVNEDGRMVRYKEWYGGDQNKGLKMGAAAVAAKAWDMSIDDGVTVMVADPACWSKGGLTDEYGNEPPSIAETFEAAGFEMIKGKNDRKQGLMRIHDLMQTRGEDDRPFLMVMDNCTHWLRTVPYMTYDARDPEDVNTELEDHCFPAGTLVATRDGPIPIERIRRGDYVITRHGHRQVLDTWDEGLHQTVVSFFDNGRILESTAAHKVYVDGRGFVRVDEMRYGDIVVFTEDLCQQNASCSTESLSGDTQNRSETKTGDISNHRHATDGEELKPCIERYGSTETGRSRKAGRYTTSTEILGITTYRTLSAYLQKIISAVTTAAKSTTQKAVESWLQLGTEAQKALHGTARTPRSSGKKEPRLIEHARSAGRHSRAEPVGRPISVRTSARPVRFVGSIPGTIQRVYDLSVQDVHEYFADGFLVSNCYDETRYAVMSEYSRNPKALRRRETLPAMSRSEPYDELRHGLTPQGVTRDPDKGVLIRSY